MAVGGLQLVAIELIDALNIPEALPNITNTTRNRSKVKSGVDDGLSGHFCHFFGLTTPLLPIFFHLFDTVLHQLITKVLCSELVPIGSRRRLMMLARFVVSLILTSPISFKITLSN